MVAQPSSGQLEKGQERKRIRGDVKKSRLFSSRWAKEKMATPFPFLKHFRCSMPARTRSGLAEAKGPAAKMPKGSEEISPEQVGSDRRQRDPGKKQGIKVSTKDHRWEG